MTQIFIAYSPDDLACAEQIRYDLEAKGYLVWKETPTITPTSASYPRMIETGIRGSAALVVVWSAKAALSEWVEREILFGQRLKKPIWPVIIDGTELPITLVNIQSITGQASCSEAATQLLSHLPPPDSEEVLLSLLDQLAHEHIRERKAGIQRAAELLQKEEYREVVLALLEDVARTDLIEGVREEAQAVLDSETRKSSPPPFRTEESRHIFGMRCSKGHVTYFDKRRVCPDSGAFVRTTVQRARLALDEISLKCETCQEEKVVRVDCEGYKP